MGHSKRRFHCQYFHRMSAPLMLKFCLSLFLTVGQLQDIWKSGIHSEVWHMMKWSNTQVIILRQRYCVLTENWACCTWMHWPSLSGQHHILSSQLCTRSSSLLTAELSIGWLPTQCSALGHVRLVWYTIGRTYITFFFWLNKE